MANKKLIAQLNEPPTLTEGAFERNMKNIKKTVIHHREQDHVWQIEREGMNYGGPTTDSIGFLETLLRDLGYNSITKYDIRLRNRDVKWWQFWRNKYYDLWWR